ncbi:MAG: hypothetical protein HYY24_11235 [Verrucomicrobia bacterium]|nr:hypothetical protein [Verrucomicrobiota bacterium]
MKRANKHLPQPGHTTDAGKPGERVALVQQRRSRGRDHEAPKVRVRRPNFLKALEKLDYSESAGVAVLEGMEV